MILASSNFELQELIKRMKDEDIQELIASRNESCEETRYGSVRGGSGSKRFIMNNGKIIDMHLMFTGLDIFHGFRGHDTPKHVLVYNADTDIFAELSKEKYRKHMISLIAVSSIESFNGKFFSEWFEQADEQMFIENTYEEEDEEEDEEEYAYIHYSIPQLESL